jgi:hypothetical protein
MALSNYSTTGLVLGEGVYVSSVPNIATLREEAPLMQYCDEKKQKNDAE